MMNYKLGFILISCTTFSNAERIHIPSTVTPEGMRLEKYNELSTIPMQIHNRQAEKITATAKAKSYVTAKADVATKAKVNAEAKHKADFEQKFESIKAPAVQELSEEVVTTQKAEAKKIASSAKRDFENKIKRAWIVPENSSGLKASARITLTNEGAVAHVVVIASNPEIKASVEQAVYAAAPFPMPLNSEARKFARNISATFTVK